MLHIFSDYRAHRDLEPEKNRVYNENGKAKNQSIANHTITKKTSNRNWLLQTTWFHSSIHLCIRKIFFTDSQLICTLINHNFIITAIRYNFYYTVFLHWNFAQLNYVIHNNHCNYHYTKYIKRIFARVISLENYFKLTFFCLIFFC